MRLGEQRAHDVPPRVEIRGDQHELTETGLAQVLREHLRVPPAQDGASGPRQRRRSPNQLPERVSKAVARGGGAERRTGDAPPPAAACPASAGGPIRDQPAGREHCDERRERDRRRPRHRRRQVRPGKRRLDPRRVPRDEGGTRLHLQHLEQEPEEVHEYAAHEYDHRNQQDGDEHQTDPCGHANRPSPAVQPSGRARTPHAIGVPEPRRAVERGERRARCADAMPSQQVDLHARFLQRAEHTCVVCTVGAGSREDQGRAAFR